MSQDRFEKFAEILDSNDYKGITDRKKPYSGSEHEEFVSTHRGIRTVICDRNI